MYNSSRLNYLSLPDVIITQSGSETYSVGQLANLIEKDNSSFESIYGPCIPPSGGLFLENADSYAGTSSFSATIPSSSSVTANNPINAPFSTYGEPGTHSVFIGVDFGSAKTVDSFLISLGGVFCSHTFSSRNDCRISIYTSSNNSSWTRVSDSTNSFYFSFGTYVSSFSSVSTRYIGIIASLSFQPRGTTHVNDSVSASPSQIYFYNSAVGYNVYDMKIDLGDNYFVESIKTASTNPFKDNSIHTTVTTSIDDVEYNSTYHQYRIGFPTEANSSDFSPAVYPVTSTSAIYNYPFIYNKNDSCLYLFYRVRFYKFNLKTRQWSSLSYFPSYPSFTFTCDYAFDYNDNVIYFTTTTGSVVKYIIDEDEYEFLPNPPSGIGTISGNCSVICYVPYNNSLYVSKGGGTNLFYRYSLETDTWSSMTAVTSGYYFGVGNNSKAVYSSYDNCIYTICSDSISDTSSIYLFKYSVVNNSWTKITSTIIPSSLSFSSSSSYPAELVLDSKRNVLYIYRNNAYNFAVMYDIVLQKFFCFTYNSSWYNYNYAPIASDYKDTISGRTSICYVEEEDRIYLHGDTYQDTSLTSNSTEVMRIGTVVEDRLETKYIVNRVVRYIKITPNSIYNYPIRFTKVSASTIEKRQLSGLEETLSVPISGSKSFYVYNDTPSIVYSGTLDYQGSQYYEEFSIDGSNFYSLPHSFVFDYGVSPGSGILLYARTTFPDGVVRDSVDTDIMVLLNSVEV